MRTSAVDEAIHILTKLEAASKLLNQGEYALPLTIFSESSIGQHYRHIIEMFQCLIEGYDDSIVCYENRKRNSRLETDLEFAQYTIQSYICKIALQEKHLVFKSMLHNHDLPTTYYRELIYAIDHCVHHQAIIKMGMIFLGKQAPDNEFGVSKSTLLAKQQ